MLGLCETFLDSLRPALYQKSEIMESRKEKEGGFVLGAWGKEFLAGAMGGVAGVVCGHPLDTVRIRLQQPQRFAAPEAVSAMAVARKMVASEGTLALFKGMGTPLASIAVQNAVTFQACAVLKDALSTPGSDEPLSYAKVALAGAVAGAFQTTVLTPVDLMKIRRQLQVDSRLSSGSGFRQPENSRRGSLALAQSIVRAEGLRGLYRGFTITVLRDAPSHAVYFATYEYVLETLSPGCRKEGKESLMTVLNAGGIAGVLSWVCCYPLDVIKSRIQGQTPANLRYAGILDCAVKSVREEGYSVLFRGLGTAVARAYLVNGAIFSAYELGLRLLEHATPAPTILKAPVAIPTRERCEKLEAAFMRRMPGSTESVPFPTL